MEGKQEDLDFHMAIARASGNALFSETMELLHDDIQNGMDTAALSAELTMDWEELAVFARHPYMADGHQMAVPRGYFPLFEVETHYCKPATRAAT